MSDSEVEEKSYESYDSDSDQDFKEDFEEDEYGSESKPKIKIGPIINEDIVDDPDDMEYGGMDSDEDDVFDDDIDAPAYPQPPLMGDPDEEEDDIDYDRSPDDEDSPTQVGRVVAAQEMQPDEDDSTDDSEESDEEEEGFFQKLDKEVVHNYIDVFHPESRIHNYDEVKSLAAVTRNKNGVIIDELHRTLPFMTKFEKAKILGIRSKQLNEGAHPFVKLPPNVGTGYAIAILELAAKKIPFIIRRPIPNGGSEYWRVSDLELIN